MTGPEFKATRKRLGMTQEQVAGRYGVTRASVAHFEREWISEPRWNLQDAADWMKRQMRARTIKGRP